jgi:hypothetical protein
MYRTSRIDYLLGGQSARVKTLSKIKPPIN